jgi:hypothetical protein
LRVTFGLLRIARNIVPCRGLLTVDAVECSYGAKFYSSRIARDYFILNVLILYNTVPIKKIKYDNFSFISFKPNTCQVYFSNLFFLSFKFGTNVHYKQFLLFFNNFVFFICLLLSIHLSF